MCGIAGTVGVERGLAVRAVEAMSARMWARGPDDGGVEHLGRAVLGSRRLAIIDPSPGGHQPMRDPERGTTIVFNGMTYNFRDLRERLARDGVRFQSDCDTEVVLKAYGRYGAACVEHIRGMFALAVWDERDSSLFLARDRLGIKPLYYARRGSSLAFASQVKALLASGLVEPALSLPAIRTFLAYGAVSEPLTAIDGVVALPAAHRATFRDARLEVERYWEPPEGAEVEVDEVEAARELRALLEDVVRRHLVSDAPLGVFLSGGLDSSLLAALAARETRHVRTVSVVFGDSSLSEREHMERVAHRIGSAHVWAPLSADDLLRWTDDAFDAMDQPTFDGINTYVVSRAAAQTGLKVALSGLGADELFDGYGYARRVALLERARRLPAPVTAAAGHALAVAGDRPQAAKARAWLVERPEPGSSYEFLRRLFLPAEVVSLVRDDSRNGTPEPPRLAAAARAAEVARLDLANYMRNVLLRDTDAMSMANSLEVRVPYLDHPFVERVLRLPPRLVAGRDKALLASAARDVLPIGTLERRKQGFVLPLAAWMRGPMRDGVEETLARPPDALAGLLDEREVARVWDGFARDGRRWLRPWSLFALYRWTETIA